MFQTLTGSQFTRTISSLLGGLTAAAALLGLPGFTRADAKSDAREAIRLIKMDIADAAAEISKLEGRILSGDVLIVTNELALAEAKKKPDNDAAVLALEVTLGLLKAKKNDLTKEKQAWEQSKRKSEKDLAEWEAYLRQLGG